MNKILRRSIFTLVISSAFAMSFVYLNKNNKDVSEERFDIAELPVAPYSEEYHALPAYSFTSEPNYVSQQLAMTFNAMAMGNVPSKYTGKNVKLAIIDSGINYNHEDFQLPGVDIVNVNSTTIEVKGSSIYKYTKTQNQSKLLDANGHGTNVASCIASQINGVGGSGIAPGVDLYIYNVVDYQWGAIQTALNECYYKDIDVINMSIQAYKVPVTYGGTTYPASYPSDDSSIYSIRDHINACYNNGSIIVAAAGNYNTNTPSYPASYNNVISVGSLARSSSTSKAGYSNTYGIDLVTSGSVYVAAMDSNSYYKETQGTSFSSPLVAGAIALYKEKYPTASQATIKSALLDSCDPISGNPAWAGSGRLNVERFLNEDYSLDFTNVDDEFEITAGSNFQLEWAFTPNTISNKKVHFDNLDDSVLTVSDTGLITALSEGESTIQIYSDENYHYYDEVTVTVTAVPAPTISSIAVKTPPTKTSYIEGEHFNPNGLVITATYSDNSKVDVSYSSNPSAFSFSPTTLASLSTSNTSVTISYDGKSCSQAITVVPETTLSSISISGYTTNFVEGDTFSFGGTVIANYSDNTHANVTNNATYSGYNMTNTGNQTITVSYTYKGVTKSQTYNINVAQGLLTSIAVSGQTTVYSKNASFSFDGVCTATFENGYQKAIAPTSVSSPDMSTAGYKTVTVSLTYNGRTRSTSYNITVQSNRTVIETSTVYDYGVIGTISWPDNTETISSNLISITAPSDGYATAENNSIRLGSKGDTGEITVTATSSIITKIVISAKAYSSDTGVHLTIDGTDNTITSSYSTYYKEFATATDSVVIATIANKKRANIQTITVYQTVSSTIETDISNSEDCLGLEVFINDYMHMDYTQNLGYCKDSEHHYYSTAKTAFNALNAHQRTLFTSNSAYLVEWTRLSTWASKNGDSLNQSTLLSSGKFDNGVANISNSSSLIIVVVSASIFTISLGYLLLKKKKQK